MTVVRVDSESSETGYPVFVERGVRSRLPDLLKEFAESFRYAFISDETVADLYGEELVEESLRRGLDAELFSFPAGEASKCRAIWSDLTDRMLEAGFGRDTTVVAVGGGVTGDLAGFVAATFMRGIPVVQVPTSLVAMIDASVGGKTGVDVPAGKNLVGAFHPPRAVIADPEVVGTLPQLERAQGLIEAVKHGAIRDVRYFGWLEERATEAMAGEPAVVEELVLGSVELKAEVVSRDERESGLREVLNFGHTLGHAFEAASDLAVPHGSAVGVGMILEARLGEVLEITETGTSERLRGVVNRLGLPTDIPEAVRMEEVIDYTRQDKKGRRGESRYVLLEQIGKVASDSGWSRPVDDGVIHSVIRS